MSTDVIAYLRVSTTMQSIERQRGDLDDDQARYDLVVAETFTDEGIGASLHTTKIRSDYEALLTLIKSGKVNGQMIWLVEASRISRNLEDFGVLRAECRKRGIRWFLSDYGRAFDLADDKDRETVTDAILKGEKESAQLSVRIRSGVRATVKNRRPHGRIPFGYTREYHGKSGVSQVPHPVYAPILIELVERYAAGESAHAIAADFDARGIPAPDDATKLERDQDHVPASRWHPTDIARRAVKVVYLGMRQYRGKQERLVGEHEGDWPALISAELHHACAERVRVAKSASYVPRRARHLLSGIAKCGGRCGGVGYVGTREKYGRQVYTCAKGCMTLPEAEVDAVVMDKVEAILTGDDYWRRVTQADPDAVAAARNRLADAQDALARLRAMFVADEISDEAFTAKEPVRRAAVRDAEAALTALTTPGRLAVLIDPTGQLTPWMMFIHRERPIEIQRQVIAELMALTLIPLGGSKGREFVAKKAVQMALKV